MNWINSLKEVPCISCLRSKKKGGLKVDSTFMQEGICTVFVLFCFFLQGCKKGIRKSASHSFPKTSVIGDSLLFILSKRTGVQTVSQPALFIHIFFYVYIINIYFNIFAVTISAKVKFPGYG